MNQERIVSWIVANALPIVASLFGVAGYAHLSGKVGHLQTRGLDGDELETVQRKIENLDTVTMELARRIDAQASQGPSVIEDFARKEKAGQLERKISEIELDIMHIKQKLGMP